MAAGVVDSMVRCGLSNMLYDSTRIESCKLNVILLVLGYSCSGPSRITHCISAYANKEIEFSPMSFLVSLFKRGS